MKVSQDYQIKPKHLNHPTDHKKITVENKKTDVSISNNGTKKAWSMKYHKNIM